MNAYHSVEWSHSQFKRKNSSGEEENCENVKRKKCSWYVMLESDSPLPTDDESESIHSFQDNETVYVRDTSDTSTHTWNSSDSDVSVDVEYEVASLSEDEEPFPDQCSSSDPGGSVIIDVITTAICDESDMGWADNSSDVSRNSIDSEIGLADYWTCVQCNARNNNPLFRYCEKCYRIRKNFFPPRPKWKKKRECTKSEETIRNTDSGLGSQESCVSGKNEISTSTLSNLNELKTDDSTTNEQLKSNNINDSSVKENNLESIEGDIRENNQSELNTTDSSRLCITCVTNSINGAFIHGKTLHFCCCYSCAKKIWRTSRRCPICNRKLNNIMKSLSDL